MRNAYLKPVLYDATYIHKRSGSMKKQRLFLLSCLLPFVFLGGNPSFANSLEGKPSLSLTKEEAASFSISPIPDAIFQKMRGKSYKNDCPVPKDDLRYVRVLHKTLDGKTKAGELIVNRLIAQDALEIFHALYKANYAIEKMRLIDEYDADDERSMRDNNTSSFNYRTISGTKTISKHGLGLAIDINPLYNPYVKKLNGKLHVEPATGKRYLARDKTFSYKIDHKDLTYKLFTERGFDWGGDWKTRKDYQHFELPTAEFEKRKASLHSQK